MAGWQGYNDWLKKVNDSGMYFSDWDLQRAANDENYANQAYNIKSGWYGAQAAGDQAGMDKYHTDMENLRAGTNFSGGQYGDEYHPWDDGSAQAKPTYTAPAASSKPSYAGTTTPRPTWDADGSVSAALNAAAEAVRNIQPYTSRLQGQIDEALAGIGNYGPYVSPYQDRIESALTGIEGYAPYESKYGDQIDAQMQAIQDRDPFTYDLESDPAWQAYKKQYTREGRRATEDTLGQYAAMTGGMPSTAAMTAASQAGDYYNAQMTDKIPELYKLAYSMYSDEGSRMLQNLNALRGLDSDDYAKYADAYNRMLQNLSALQSQDATEYGRYGDTYTRMLQNLSALQGQDSTEYGRYSDNVSRLFDTLSAERSLYNDAYGRFRDTVGDWESDRAFDWNAYLSDLNQWNTDRSFDYGVYSDALNQWNKDRAYNDEQTALAYDQAWNAYLKAGDDTLLRALGITPNTENLLAYTLASNGRTVPVGSGGSGGGGGGGGAGSGSDTGDEDSGKWADVEAWVALYGAKSAENYIKEHYKDLGYSSQSAALAGWNNHLLESGLAEKEYEPSVDSVKADGKKDSHDVMHGIADDLGIDSVAGTGWGTYTPGGLFGTLSGNGYVPSSALSMEANGYAPEGDYPVNMGSVTNLGYGPISAERLSDLVNSGEVIKYLQNGQWYFRKA